MRLERLEATNFRLLRTVDIVFPDGLIGIGGVNGAGKSSLLEAIGVACYGAEASRTTKEDLVGPLDDDLFVRFGFSLGDHQYVVERSFTGKHLSAKARLTFDGAVIAEGTDPVSAEVSKLIGGHNEVMLSRFVRQKQLADLSSYDPAPRKRLILNLLGIGGVEEAVKSLREQVRAADADIKARRSVLPNVTEIRRLIKELQAGARSTEAIVAEAAELIARRRAELVLAEATLAAADRSAELAAAQATTLNLLATTLAELAEEEAASAMQQQDPLELAAELATFESELARIAASRDTFATLEAAWALRRRAPDLVAQSDSLRQSRAALDEDVARLTALAAQEPGLLASRAALLSAHERLTGEIATAEAERAESRTALLRVREELARLDLERRGVATAKAGESICPTCRQPLADLEAFRADLEAHRAAAAAAEQDILARGTTAKQRSELASSSRDQGASQLSAIEESLRLARAAAGDLRLVKARAFELAELAVTVAAELAEAEAIHYDAAQHSQLSLAIEGWPALTTAAAAVRLRLAEAQRAAADGQRLRERRLALEARQAAAAAEASAAGYHPTEHAAARELAAAGRASLTAAEVAHAERVGELALLRDQLAREEKSEREHARLTTEIGALMVERGLLELTRETMDRFKVSLIGRIRPALARRASELLQELTEGRYTDLVLDEDYNVSYGADGATWPIKRASGGEEDLINLCLRLSISDLISETGGLSSSFVVLDEILPFQDEARKANVMVLLERLLVRYRQILMIDHHPDIAGRFANFIEVEYDPATKMSRALYRPATSLSLLTNAA